MRRAAHFRVLLLPLAAVLTFLVTSIALFYLGPFNWPIRNHEALALFLICIVAAIAGGFTLGITGLAKTSFFSSWQNVLVFGAVSSCVMIFPSAYIYTGKMPWDALSALMDQGQAYRDFLARLVELEGTRGPLVFLRALTHWASYAVVPLAILNWRRLNIWIILLVAGAIAANATFSLLRATDQGTFDLIFLIAMASMIVICRHSLNADRPLERLLFAGRGAVVVLISMTMLGAAMFMFSERKTARYEGQIDRVCFGEEMQVCANWNHPLAARMSEQGRFTFGIAVGYASAGYYGLALSLDRGLQSTYGLGHSPALMRIYETLTGDTELYKRSFTYRLRKDAWSDEYLWSTMYTWLANDVGFLFTIPIIGAMAMIWGASWRDAVRGRNDAAGIVACMMTQTFLYAPANFQLGLGLDTYAALIVWIAIWKMPTCAHFESAKLK